MLFTDFPPVKMKCYPMEKIEQWIEEYLSDEAHTEKLVLGDADVEEYRSNRNKLLGKRRSKKKSLQRNQKEEEED